MSFDDFADYLEKLEQTSSRLVLIEILAGLFQKLHSDEISKVIYLIQGRVAPFYEAVEIGMAEKSVAASIARAFGLDKEKVLQKFAQAGDLGIVAMALSQKQERKKQNLSIAAVFNTLRKIAETSGEGTIEKKITALADLFQGVEKVAAKHLARIPLGTSRLGVGDPTILEALASAYFGDRKNRSILETAYNKTSDLGLIGITLLKNGLGAVEKLDVGVGRPLRPELCERLPDAETILEKYNGLANVQPKMDGFRVQIHLDKTKPQGKQVRLFSRNLEETTVMFPDITLAAIKQIKAQKAILDSEALAFNPQSEEFLPFQETTKRRRKYNIEEMAKKLPLKAFIFDLMYLNSRSLLDLPLAERLKKLAKIIAGKEVLIAEPGELVTSVERMNELFDDALTKGLEGLVVKRSDSKYEAGGRNFNWVKLKRHSAGELKDTIDCVILGYIFGRGKRAEFGAGALLVGVYNQEKDQFETVSKIGTGLTDEEWKEVHQQADKIRLEQKPARVNSLIIPSVWIKPKIVIEVLADEITCSPVHTAGKEGEKPGLALRFPRLVKFRPDKKPEDATTTQELTELFKAQT